MSIVVATTLTTFAMDDEEIWGSWLLNSDEIKASHTDVRYFAAVEEDARGLAPFLPLTDRLSGQGDEWWTYRLDDGRSSVTTANRLRHLTVGQNLATDYALSDPACTHL